MACLTLALFTLPAQAEYLVSQQPSPTGSRESAVLARVNGEPITEQMVLRRLQAVHGDVETYRRDPNRWQGMREAAIQAEIRDRLLLQAAITEKLKVSRQEVRDAFDRSHRLLGEKRFRAMLTERGATEADYYAFLRERMLIDKYKAKLFKDISVDEQTLRSYYEGHQELVTVPRLFHLESVRVETATVAQEIVTRLKAGDNLEHLAGKLSKGSGTPLEVRRAWIAEDDLPAQVRKAADTGGGPGDVLEPIPENGGLRVVRILESKAPQPQRYDEVRESLRSTLLRRRQQAALDQWYERARRRATIKY